MKYFKWFDEDDKLDITTWVYDFPETERDWIDREIEEKGYATSVIFKNCLMLEVYDE